MDPVRNEATPITSTGQRLEAVSQNPELINKKVEVTPKAEIPKESVPIKTPITKAEKDRRFYMGGVGAAIVFSLIALVVAMSANHSRVSDQALVDSFASALAKNSAPNSGLPGAQNTSPGTSGAGMTGYNTTGNNPNGNNTTGNTNGNNTNPITDMKTNQGNKVNPSGNGN